ncbi:hypothetical protein [Falsirhodobacter sp. 20TX0035]|uniref:hypothetical protein n=1 Tax=Falsirhodobacter sp. 20TX0035 TaxID=3022019 RepID=UPI00232D2A38|nr:hypothetical protein [Falsirhodobacter sp. 20TX0035]MDB6455035.1 hypothetical protein [Falsirhodobacter sp. 20TX0035]
MALTKTTVTGRVPLPTDLVLPYGQIWFTLRSLDVDKASRNVLMPVTVTAAVGKDGTFRIDLWPNARGDRGTVYDVSAHLKVGAGRPDLAVPMGPVVVPEAGPVDISALLQIPVSAPTPPDVLAQVLAAAAVTEGVQASAAQVRQDRIATENAAAAAGNALPAKYTRATKALLDAVQGAAANDIGFVTAPEASGGGYYSYSGTAWVYIGQGALAGKADAIALTALEKSIEQQFRPKVDPGKIGLILATDAANKPLLAIDQNGRILGDFVIPESDEPEVPPVEFPVSGDPGEHLVDLFVDESGHTLLAIDTRTGTLWPPTSPDEEETPPPVGGTTVEFYEPAWLGNAWQAIKSDGVGRFLSDAWRGKTIGYEDRNGKILAQTPSVAVGVAAFGGGASGVAASTKEPYRWHLVNEALAQPERPGAAQASAAAWLDRQGALARAWHTMIAVTEAVPSTVEADALEGSAKRTALMTRIAAAVAAAEAFGKTVVFDRLHLSLLEGAPATLELTADSNYAAVGNSLRLAIAETTGQGEAPAVVVSQSAGTRSNGASEVILAEGRLHIRHFSLGFLVTTPRYPFALQAGTAGTLTADAALRLAEIEAHALEAVQAGGEWYPPSLETATRAGAVITARFYTLSSLVLDDPTKHGFAVDGVTNGATITSVTVNGDLATITMSAVPTGTLTLRYAFGETADRGDGFPANRGSLRDSWSAPSANFPNETLYRRALSGRVAVQ